MSARHVWDKHQVKVNTTRTSTQKYSYNLIESSNHVANNDNEYEVVFRENTPQFHVPYSYGGVIVRDGTDYTVLGVPPRKYLLPITDWHYEYSPEMLSMLDDYGNYNVHWAAKRNGTLVEVWVEGWINVGSLLRKNFYVNKVTGSKGDYIEPVSSPLRSDYPDDRQQYSYWYVYKGSDNIDPSSVKYSPGNPQAGNSVTISVTPRSPTYGGTIQYQFSYSIDGGKSWTNIGNKTTSTNVSVTIPADAKEFQAGVIASDTWGFTSMSRVTGWTSNLNSAPTPPSYVTIPDEIYSGDSVSIYWGASTDPDGNLSGYEVQRAYDGGSNWATVTSNTTETSFSDAVQEGLTSVRYRVRAKDSQGLTSSWTESNSALIGQLKAFASVSGVSRAGVKMYAVVDGKIREVQKGYAMVGGKVRKLF